MIDEPSPAQFTRRTIPLAMLAMRRQECSKCGAKSRVGQTACWDCGSKQEKPRDDR